MLPTPDLEAAVAMDSHNLDVSALRDEDPIVDVPSPNVAQKKKKKKKPKKSAKLQEETNKTKSESRPNVLCISRNKHWKFISSYHGPWLQLPVELLESLMTLNSDPATFTASESRMYTLPSPSSPSLSASAGKQRDRAFDTVGDFSPPSTPHNQLASLPMPPPLPNPGPGKVTPPPIDPGIFRCVTQIRRLIDEASELSVRASSGLSAAELGSLRNSGYGGGSWATAQSLGINPLGGNGRNVAMSAMRIHRLRALAVQKLSQAYRLDEIASSVMVMQGGSVFDDLAERVLKNDPTDVDARYVQFFHEKIPSRQLAESTSTIILDDLIRAQPHRLEFRRTRGVVHSFREEYTEAAKDFTVALREARALRKAKTTHHGTGASSDFRNGKGRAKKSGGKSNGRAPPSGTSVLDDNYGDFEPDTGGLVLHPSVLPDAPEPIEAQCLFLRGNAYLQHAISLVEAAAFRLEGVTKASIVDGAELRLCYLEGGRFGGTEVGHPDGPLGNKHGAKQQAYRDVMSLPIFKEQVTNLIRKGMRDHERFLAHFDTLEAPDAAHLSPGNLAEKVNYAFLASEAIRPGNHGTAPPLPDTLTMFTTYHPLLVESHFSILLGYLMLADFERLLPTFIRTAALVDGLEGYPIFLPPRSMAQAEFIEILERLASGWKAGTQPHSMSSRTREKERSEQALLPTPPPSSDGSSSSRHSPEPCRPDAAEALDYARILLAPVVKRQKERQDKDKAMVLSGKKKPLSINIPLHGPRVEVVLAWFAAVHIPELDV